MLFRSHPSFLVPISSPPPPPPCPPPHSVLSPPLPPTAVLLTHRRRPRPSLPSPSLPTLCPRSSRAGRHPIDPQPDPPPRPAPRPTHPNRRESSLAERHGLGDALAHLHGPRGREGRRRRRRRQLRQGDHRLGTAPTLLAFPRQGLRQGKPLSLEAHGPGGDRPKKPRRYGVMEMRSPCYSFRPAHHALQVIVVKAAMGRRGGFGTSVKSYVSPPGRGFGWTSD